MPTTGVVMERVKARLELELLGLSWTFSDSVKIEELQGWVQKMICLEKFGAW